MNNRKGYKRKNYFINKGFQGRYMFNFYLLLALFALVFAILLSYTTAQHLTISYENYALQVASTPAMLFKHVLMVVWVIMIPLGLLLAWAVMRHTHRIAGPLYKFETVLEQMSRGVLDPHVRLRENDDGQEVIARLQEVNRFLSDKIHEMRRLTDQLHASPEVINSPELQKLTGDLRHSLAGFEIREQPEGR
ncbi:MAG: hypothetical protein KKG47_06690 [Proteobacteria bacterium]|nr:hypothetical protein [Pseudomonadota bacterium]MBU1739739.1 hypothetical protein [Pseudomonadota bacterium]